MELPIGDAAYAALLLPNELLLKIFELTGRQTQQNLRRCSHHFCDLASSIFFRSVMLPSDRDHLHKAVDVLSRPHVGIHIRNLSLSCDNFVPDQYQTKLLRKKYVEDYALESVTDFVSQLTRLLFSVRKNLQHLSIAGFLLSKMLSWRMRALTERPYLRGIVDVLTIVYLSDLREIEMQFAVFDTISPLCESYKRQKDNGSGILLSNIERLSSFTFMHMSTGDKLDVTEARGTKEFLLLAENMPQLASLKLILPGNGTEHDDFLMSIASVLKITTLSSLCLRGACLSDALSPILANLSLLPSLTLWAVKLDVIVDSWEKVCNEILNLQDLEDLDMRNCGYNIIGVFNRDHEPTGLCSAYEEDRLAYGKVRDRIKTLKSFKNDPEQVPMRLNKWDVCLDKECWISFLTRQLKVSDT